MSRAFVTRVTISAFVGSGPNSRAKSFGALTSAMRDPSFIPIFFGNGVPEYPATVCRLELVLNGLPEPEYFPPRYSDHTPDQDGDDRSYQSKRPPRTLRGVARAEIDRRRGRPVMRQRRAEI